MCSSWLLVLLSRPPSPGSTLLTIALVGLDVILFISFSYSTALTVHLITLMFHLRQENQSKRPLRLSKRQ